MKESLLDDIARARVGHMSRWRRFSLYFASLGILGTGVIWLYAHYVMKTIDSYGFENAHPAEKWSLIAHAAVSFYGLWWFGLLWPNHIYKSWRARIRRMTGGILFGCIAWLGVTGVALYYIGEEFWRGWVSVLHWAVGILAALVFGIHLKTRSPRSDSGPAA